MTREQVRAALTDPVALVCTLYGEARGESIAGIIAVGCAIRNRVLADLGNDGKPDWWGETFTGVCLARAQFTCWWQDNDNSRRVYELAEQLLQRRHVGEVGLVPELRWIAEGLVGYAIRDHVRGADHYCTTAMFEQNPPAWAKNPVCTMGAHTFFRLG